MPETPHLPDATVLSREVVAGFTLGEVLAAFIVLIVIVNVINRVRRANMLDRGSSMKANCARCGWHGTVSMNARKCPKCGSSVTM